MQLSIFMQMILCKLQEHNNNLEPSLVASTGIIDSNSSLDTYPLLKIATIVSPETASTD